MYHSQTVRNYNKEKFWKQPEMGKTIYHTVEKPNFIISYLPFWKAVWKKIGEMEKAW